MNWYNGNIAEAVAHSKEKNAIFVVYIEGKDESSKKLTKFIDDDRIRAQLENDDFVAIKIESDAQAYIQFASIYQVVPVPSIFFIGKTGTPLEIGTGIIASVDELCGKIEKVLLAAGKLSGSTSASASSSFISAEQTVANNDAALSTAPGSAESESLNNAAQASEEIICENGVCFKKPKAGADPIIKVEPTAEKTVPIANAEPEIKTESEGSNTHLEETRKLLEQKRRERIEEEKKAEKERELRRRREGKEVQNIQKWQHEQELKELKENIRRERLEEQATRERIRSQIAADRIERARKAEISAAVAIGNVATSQPSSSPTTPNSSAGETARIQFRLSSGDSKTHSFNRKDTLATVRTYVTTELLQGTAIRDYTLATTYPKREFTSENNEQTLVDLGLFPSAVILVIGKEGRANPAAVIARYGGVLNVMTTVFWALLSPVVAIYDYLRNAIGGRGDNGAKKRANEEQGAQQDPAKRRNLDRFMSGASGGVGATVGNDNSKASSPQNSSGNTEQKPYRRYGSSNVHRLRDQRDSDDENATWNGNSTQQQ